MSEDRERLAERNRVIIELHRALCACSAPYVEDLEDTCEVYEATWVAYDEGVKAGHAAGERKGAARYLSPARGQAMTRPAQQRRSTLCRMAGNIAAGLVPDLDADDEIAALDWMQTVANVSVHLAERIYALIEERHPDPCDHDADTDCPRCVP